MNLWLEMSAFESLREPFGNSLQVARNPLAESSLCSGLLVMQNTILPSCPSPLHRTQVGKSSLSTSKRIGSTEELDSISPSCQAPEHPTSFTSIGCNRSCPCEIGISQIRIAVIARRIEGCYLLFGSIGNDYIWKLLLNGFNLNVCEIGGINLFQAAKLAEFGDYRSNVDHLGIVKRYTGHGKIAC